MSNYEQTRARVAGRQAIQQQTIWQVEADGAKFRCLVLPTGCTVQEKTGAAWKTLSMVGIPAGRCNPSDLLIRLAGSLAKTLGKKEAA